MASLSVPYSTTRLSDTVLRITETDPYDQTPFMYVIFGDERAALVDTGCNCGDLLTYLRGEDFLQHCTDGQRRLIFKNLVVINTHCHFDHVASNFRFSPANGQLTDGVEELCMSSYDKDFSAEKFHTLWWYAKCDVKPYRVTKWLDDRSTINLSGERGKMDENAAVLDVIHAPGHTPDSLCLYYRKERRLFVGDVIYSSYGIFAVGPQSHLDVFEKSMRKLDNFVQEKTSSFADKSSKILLSCGHLDDNLESAALGQFENLLHKVNTNTIPSKRSCCSLFAEYETDDKRLSLIYRKGQSLDVVVRPVLKLWFG